MAAARIPATTSPATPGGSLVTTNVGKMASLRIPAWSAPASQRLVPASRNSANWAMMNTPDPTSARGEQALDDQVIRAVRGAGEQRPAHHTAPERVQHRERRPEVERHELPRFPGPRELAHASREPRRDDERRDPAQEIHAQLDHVHPHDGAEPAHPRIDHGHDADREDPGGQAPSRDDRERNGRGEDTHAVGERAGEQKDARGGATRRAPEAPLQALVRGVLRPLEVARQEPGGDADPTHEVAEGDL